MDDIKRMTVELGSRVVADILVENSQLKKMRLSILYNRMSEAGMFPASKKTFALLGSYIALKGESENIYHVKGFHHDGRLYCELVYPEKDASSLWYIDTDLVDHELMKNDKED